MSGSFDAYQEWLGIPLEEQPPNHYRLLNLRPLENDSRAIRNAVDQRTIHLKGFALGEHVAQSQKLLNEVAAAWVCLSDAEKKARYDRELGEKLHLELPVETTELPRITLERPPPSPTPTSTPPDQPVSARTVVRAMPRAFDRSLGRIAGEGNTILHNFLRALAVGGVVLGAALLPRMMGEHRAESSRHMQRAAAGGATRERRPEREEPPEEASPQEPETESDQTPPEAIDIPSVSGDLTEATRASPEPASEPDREPTAEPDLKRTPEPDPEPTELPENFSNHIGMKFKLIPAGEFIMGSPKDDPDKESGETPQHRVQITKPFYLGVYEVTQAQYENVMGNNPSSFKEPSRPVVWVFWEDARTFCETLSETDARQYRLPTEAEWEYACRAGETRRYSCGNNLDPQYAWFVKNSGGETHPVGSRLPNAWGLYDMHGNVWEWCHDWYDESYYAKSLKVDPTGPSDGSYRVYRGGGWIFNDKSCRSGNRNRGMPAYRSNHLGFRVALVPAE